MSKTDELMSVGFNVTDSGLPCLVFCSEFQVPMTSKWFVSSYINYYENDLKFKIGNMSSFVLNFAWYSEDKNILEVYLKKDFMGLASVSEIYTNLLLCQKQLQELKEISNAENQ